MPLLPKNLHNLRDLREKNSPFRGDKQKFLVSFNFPIVALDGKFPFPWRSFFFIHSLRDWYYFCFTPTRSRSLAFVGVSHRGNAFPQFQCLRHSKVCRVKIKLDTRDAHPPIKSVQSAKSA